MVICFCKAKHSYFILGNWNSLLHERGSRTPISNGAKRGAFTSGNSIIDLFLKGIVTIRLPPSSQFTRGNRGSHSDRKHAVNLRVSEIKGEYPETSFYSFSPLWRAFRFQVQQRFSSGVSQRIRRNIKILLTQKWKER